MRLVGVPELDRQSGERMGDPVVAFLPAQYGFMVSVRQPGCTDVLLAWSLVAIGEAST